MATLLYRIARFAYRHALLVLIGWLVVAGGVLGGGVALGGQSQESFEIPGTESQAAIDRLERVFPQTAGASAQIVVQAPEGETIESDEVRSEIEELTASVADLDGVDQALDPYSEYATEAQSEDGRTGIVQVQFDGQAADVSEETLHAMEEAGQVAEDAGLTVAYGGQVFQDVEYGVTATELIGVGFAALVLFVTFGSLLAAGLPLLTAITGLAISMGGVLAVSAFATISAATPLLALMIGLAVGIDYALFILSRHRTQLAQGMDPEESAATAVATAGSSVVFAGVTVVIALVGLLVVGIPFLGVMGLAAAVAVVLAMLTAVTMLPALLGLAKSRLTPKPGSRAHRRANAGDTDRAALGTRWVRLVMRAPVVFIIAVVGVLGTLAIPAFSLQLALPDGGSEPETSTARQAYDLTSDAFGPGRNGPLIVALDITQSTDPIGDLAAIGDELARIDGVQSTTDGIPNETVDTGIVQVVPETGPTDPATADLVERIRDAAPGIERDYDMEMWVTGTTAVQIDISTRLNDALIPFGIIVVGLSIVLLTAVFRSIVVPIKAAAGFLLSVFAAFGVVVAVFQWGWGADALGVEPGPILSFMPVLLIAILFGLAMDYQVFMVSGMREAYVHGERTREGAKRAVVAGFTGAARVVTAAAAIMFFVFAAFVPEGAGVIKVIALGLAVGIAADAFLIRMTLVPAVMALAGRGAWYLPRWLGRILPHFDIEGEGLRDHREEAEWAESRTAAVTLDGLVVGEAGGPSGPRVGPVWAEVPRGALALVDGTPASRRLLAAALGGRIEPSAGRAQAAGVASGTDSARAARVVALADLTGPGRDEVDLTVRDLLAERLRVVGRGSVARRTDSWLHRLRLSGDETLSGLDPVRRAVVIAAAALAEESPVVLLDVPDGIRGTGLDTLLAAVDELAPSGTTVLVGQTRLDPAAGVGLTRPLLRIDLDVAGRTESAPPSRHSTSLEGAAK